MKNKVPKLRFPEFSGEWENLKIKEIALLKGGFAFKSNNFLTEKSNYQVIKMGNLYQNKLLLDRNPSFLENITLKEKEYLLEKGDILITLTGTVGKRDFGYSYQINNEKNLLLNQRLALIKSKQEVANNKFLKYIVLKNQFLDQFFEASAGGTGNQANVSIKNIEDFIVILPSLPEQEKIANFLSSVDIKIEKLEKKKELLEEYKKGMMQKLFSQKLRFKDENGNDYPEWEEKKLGEIGFFQTSSVDKLYIEGENEVKLVNYMNVYRHEKIDNNAIKNYQIVTAKNSQIQTSNLLRGDILFTPSSETPEDIGHSVVIFENLEKCVFSYHLMRFRPNIELDILYSHYFCNNKNVLNQIIRLATGSTRFTISVKSFSSIKILLPTISEQEKIANFLFSIDRKIELIEKELEKNREFKKGLLQQMFI